VSRELSPELAKRLAEQLGLPPDADNATITAAVQELVDKRDEAAARQIDQAVAIGAISATHRQVWLNSFKADYDGTKAALAAIKPRPQPAPAPAPTRAATRHSPDDGGMTDQEANNALWALGIRAGLTPPDTSRTRYLLANEDGTPFDSKSA
jgi:hypothetical protein